ncbi:MAG: thiamine-phosphate kinase [Deltaproteobacteria bacterium]|nr:thiamine-phosphate kinase [Deltaproteobacteria bacterium]
MSRAGAPPGDELRILADWLSLFPTAGPRVVIGPGDDAAALRCAPGKVLVTTTDAMVEGVHFLREAFPARAVGRKALAVNLSDLAAMGASSRWLLCSLVIPPGLGRRWLREAGEGMAGLCRAEGVTLVGGNISAGPKLELHLTLLGEADPARLLRRSGAREGDGIWVSGTLGDAALGLSRLQGLSRPPARPGKLQLRQLEPTARTVLGRALAGRQLASACLDVSDGLALDLRRLCEASGVGARIALEHLPLSAPARRALSRMEDPWAPPVSGGEDYELLFTVPPGKTRALERFLARSGHAATRIGEITQERRVKLVLPGGKVYRPASLGYRHQA